jgi:segregation and condensation protein A
MLVQLDGFAGPLDLLLDLARRQQVDLTQISVLALVDQYLAAIDRLGAGATRLTRAADWLVMAAWLTWLKSRLLLPHAAPEAARAAGALVDRLAQMERVRALAAWLDARPQLGRDFYPRGAPEISCRSCSGRAWSGCAGSRRCSAPGGRLGRSSGGCRRRSPGSAR